MDILVTDLAGVRYVATQERFRSRHHRWKNLDCAEVIFRPIADIYLQRMGHKLMRGL